MTTTNEALKLAAEFNRYFTSMNSIDVPERISVRRDEWRALHEAIKARLELPQQEPSYWLGYGLQAHTEKPFEGATTLYSDQPAQSAPVQSCYCPNCEALSKELAEIKQQKPVAWRVKWPAIGGGHKWIMVDKPLMEKEGFVNEALYTTPPAAPTVQEN